MFKYIVKRILFFLPTLLIISLLIFGLSQMSDDNPVARFCEMPEGMGHVDIAAQAQACKDIAQNMGLDKPPFYFAIKPKAFPDTLHQIYEIEKKEALNLLIQQYGNWDYIQKYHQQLKKLEQGIYSLPDSISRAERKDLRSAIQLLHINYQDAVITSQLERLHSTTQQGVTAVMLQEDINYLRATYQAIKEHPQSSLLYLPTLRWYGLDNQYHRWISRFIRGDFGISYSDRRPVGERIWEAARWTIIINILSILLAYLVSIPLGVFTARKQGTWQDKLSMSSLFFLYSLPTFWVATLCIVFITTPEYGMNWFPTGGLGNLAKDAPFWSRFWETAYHLILPVFCVTYTAFAFITRQMRGGMLNELEQDYVRTARAKGLDNNQVTWRHAFRNGLFPIITLLANVLPATLAGSVIVEIIFSIPGMGRLAFNSIFQGDWPVLFTVIMLSAILTLLGNLIADMLYAVADPRVRFGT